MSVKMELKIQRKMRRLAEQNKELYGTSDPNPTKLHTETSVDDILEVLKGLNEKEQEKFKKQLAESTCNEIKEKVAKNPSMELIEEETLEDGSVVLTINV